MPTIVTIVGNLVKDPEEKDFGSDKNVTNFRVACNDRIPDGNGGWKDSDTSYYNVSAWRNLGKSIASSLKKGDRVIVQGKLKYKEYKKNDGSNGYSYEVEASDVGMAIHSKSVKRISNDSLVTSDLKDNPWVSKK